MNGNVPWLFYTSVPPLRAAPCYGYSINQSIKQSYIHYFTFLLMPNLPFLHSCAYKCTHDHSGEKNDEPIYQCALCAVFGRVEVEK